jgi:hypothetical protein
VSIISPYLALTNLVTDSKLWASDLVRLKVEDACSGPIVRDRAIITQLNTRLRSSIARRETSGQSSCYLATQRSRQPSAYLGVEVDDALRRAEQIEV